MAISLRRAVLLATAGLLVAMHANAQCSQWQHEFGAAGVAGFPQDSAHYVLAMTTWDPDGPGPATPLLVVGGKFSLAGDRAAESVALYDPQSGTWSSMGAGIAGAVRALVTMPNGDVVAGGEFTTAGGQQATYIARWDGSAWSPIGSGFDWYVSALAVLPNGDLVAGGEFSTAGTTPVAYVARWDGSTWSAMGAGAPGRVEDMLVRSGGELVTVGAQLFGGTSKIMQWDGVAWTELASYGGRTYRGRALPSANGDFVVGGEFASINGAVCNGVATWNGSTFVPMATGLNSGSTSQKVLSLAVTAGGVVWAGGSFTAVGNRIASWDGSNWSTPGAGADGTVNTIFEMPGGGVFAGGRFHRMGATGVSLIARWNGSSWSPLSLGTNGTVRSMARTSDGGIVAGGAFNTIAGVAADRIARWDGSSWSAIGTWTAGEVWSVACGVNGTIAAAHNPVGGFFPREVSLWDGATWTSLGTTDQGITCIAVTDNGDVVVGGQFTTIAGVPASRVARWDGTSWSAIGLGVNSIVRAMRALRGGGFVVVGDFTTVDGVSMPRVAGSDGTTWWPYGVGLNNSARVLAASEDGELFVSGPFTQSGSLALPGLARWDGSAWQPLAATPGILVSALELLPNGDLVAGSRYTTAGTSAPPVSVRMRRYDGAAWHDLATTRGSIETLATTVDGELFAGGDFLQVEGSGFAYYARFVSNCPASVVSSGSGCAGSGGVATLTASTLPWIGGNYRVHGSGVPSLAIALDTFGFTQVNVPLSAILPSPVGCTLQVSPDAFAFQVASGAVDFDFAIPAQSALIGISLWRQLALLELAPLSLDIVQATSSNALLATIGGY